MSCRVVSCRVVSCRGALVACACCDALRCSVALCCCVTSRLVLSCRALLLWLYPCILPLCVALTRCYFAMLFSPVLAGLALSCRIISSLAVSYLALLLCLVLSLYGVHSPAASAADTPIASAKRPKRRAQQPLSSE